MFHETRTPIGEACYPEHAEIIVRRQDGSIDHGYYKARAHFARSNAFNKTPGLVASLLKIVMAGLRATASR